MKKTMESLLIKGINLKMRIGEKVKKLSGDERGSFDPVYAILFGAIVVLAIIASKSSVDTIFLDFVTDFSTWLDTKKTTLFQ